ncbi:diacylglycerol kinase [Dietzia sp. SLG310A2-38A2]|uniref:NAD(P)H-dependent amine dehydrogenase family protein n=1 Tax=Dietzia sp. SLG310A2-38A2 TaxID=1630643 RepID=UPI0015FA49FE|nr:diacylglycerol kinase [Dietzia sp. SLG310A2-38A2]MBB1031968.1 diacylglycerol kinase [Dietzia sp. SLG310A2-38A2]
MAIRVAQIATGNAGAIALRQLIEDPRFDLVGVWVHSVEKAGKDAGELAGLEVATGVTATTSAADIIAAAPDCVVYCAMSDTRPVEAARDIREYLAAGINVAGTAPTPLINPAAGIPDSARAKLEAAALEGGATLFVTGVDPGFTNDLLPLAITGTCREVRQVRCTEFSDYATYDSTESMVDVMGFGTPLDQTPLLFLPGVLTAGWGASIHLLAAGLGVEVDEITEHVEREPAPETYEVAACTIAEGTQAGFRFQITGMVAGEPVIVVEHVTRTRDDLRPDWPYAVQEGHSYRVEVIGEPSYVLDLAAQSADGDHNYSAILAGVGRVVNAVPAVVAAAPGLTTTLDLPLTGAPGIVGTR